MTGREGSELEMGVLPVAGAGEGAGETLAGIAVSLPQAPREELGAGCPAFEGGRRGGVVLKEHLAEKVAAVLSDFYVWKKDED